MWKAVTRPQSMPGSAASASSRSRWLGAAANTIRTAGRAARRRRSSAATSVAAARPMAVRSG